MSKNKNKKMNLNTGFNIYHKPVEDYFDYAVKYNLKHLEIDLIRDHSFVDSFSDERIDTLKKISESSGIHLSLHTPYNIDLAERRSKYKNTKEYMKKCIKIASRLNARHITTHIGGFYGWNIWPKMKERALDRLILNLNELSEYCKQYNTILALENVMRLPRGGSHTLLGDCIDDFKTIFSNVDSDCFKMCLDVGHANLNEGAIEYINTFKDRIVCIHFHDNKGDYDSHLAVGAGNIPWAQIATTLKNIRFYGPFISECHDIEPHEAAELLSEYFG